MRKYCVILMFALSGCFKDEPKVPQFYAQQTIDITTDSLICYSAQEDFNNFILYSSQPYDSIHWYADPFNQTFLGSGDSLILPNAPWGFETVRGIGFSINDSTVHPLQLAYCARYMYIPIAFTPDQDGINDKWFPNYYSTDNADNFQPYSVFWEIRTLEGIQVHEATNFFDAWDGDYNGNSMPGGIYLFYIELQIEGEQPLEYTGTLNLIR